MKNLSSLVWLSLLCVACRTSGELNSGREAPYVDPTNVKTVDLPPAESAAPAAPSANVERLQQELAIARGELENARVNSRKDNEALQARVADLEAKNKALMDENLRLKTRPAEPAESPKPTSASGLWEEGVIQVKTGHLNKAQELWEELSTKHPKAAQAFYAIIGQGFIQFKNKAYNEAALTFNLAIDRHPKKKEIALAWFGQAAALGQAKQSDDAKLVFDELIKRFPSSPEASLARKILRKKEKLPSDLFALFPGWAAAAPAT